MSKKGGGRPMGRAPMPGGGGGNQAAMLKQLQQLQDEMARAQEALAEKTVEVTMGGGVVKVVMNGHQKLVSLTIDPEAVDPEDVETLQDMILAAVNQASEKAEALANDSMKGVTGGLSIPGLF